MLHLVPLSLNSDSSDQCLQRGLSINTTIDLIYQHSINAADSKGGNDNTGGVFRNVDRSRFSKELVFKDFIVPQATLKRYYDSILLI